MKDEPVSLLTGATGLVGGALLKLLSVSRSRRFTILTRRFTKLEKSNDRLNVLIGDITLPCFGLDKRTYAELCETVTEIIHCAADTRFGIPLDCARKVNTAGTEEVLTLASRCRQLQKFAYISTVYVVGRSTGYFSEAPIRHGNGFCNAYQQSKYEAEELVLQAMNQIPAVVFRLSSIIGDSVTGTVAQFNHVHRLIRLFPQNVLPVAPGQPDAPIDLIPSDWAMAALTYLFEWAFVPCRFYHICAGPERSPTVREIIDLTISAFESHPAGQTYLPIRVPELVPLRCYEAFVEERHRNGDRFFNELTRVLGYFLPHLAMFQAFDNTSTMRTLAPSGLQLPSSSECYAKVARYCLDTKPLADITAKWLTDKALAQSTFGAAVYHDPSRFADETIEYYVTPLVSSPLRRTHYHAFHIALEPNPLAGIEASLKRSKVPVRIV